MSTFRLPGTDERTAIVGCTGSGKTQLGMHLLSKMPFDTMPFVMIDSKGERLMRHLRGVVDISTSDVPPTAPGLYRLPLGPENEDEMEGWLWNVKAQGGLGLYVDEGYSMPDHKAFRSILTQGRSLNIPVICLSQRPVDLPRYVFTEAQHICVFRLNDERDEEKVEKFTPRKFLQWRPNGVPASNSNLPPELAAASHAVLLPEYHARWYDVNQNATFVVFPVPSADVIRSDIEARLLPPSIPAADNVNARRLHRSL